LSATCKYVPHPHDDIITFTWTLRSDTGWQLPGTCAQTRGDN